MVAEGRDVMLTAWWVSTVPGLAIVLLVLALNVFGEGLRDILDPRLKVE
jgi:peptide/nickel transport system permease protein